MLEWRVLPQRFIDRALANGMLPGASLVNEHSRVDPDFRERSLTTRFVSARALTFWGSKKASIKQGHLSSCL